MKYAASYIAWCSWLAIFLTLELLGYWRVFGWVTFSETVWHAGRYPLVRQLVFATLVALIVHFLYRRPLWHSVLFGLAIALVAHWLDHRL